MAVTIKLLAAHCGLSVSAVSKALNNYPDVSDKTRQAVLKAAEELGYRASATAVSLKTGRSRMLGVIYADESQSGFTHSYFSPVLQSFREESERRGYDLVFVSTREGMSSLDHCRFRGVDGVCIVCCTNYDTPDIQELMNSDLPLVGIDHVVNGRSCIASENRQGMTELMNYILARGHRRIAYIHGEPTSVGLDRITAFRRAMSSAGLPVPDNYIVQGKYHHPADARRTMLGLLSLPEPPTCILMPDDYSALGGIEAIHSQGLRIPEDISIAGYDGVPVLQMCDPPLTTVAQDAAGIGAAAARKLVHLIEFPETTFNEIISIPSQLIPGSTVADLNAVP